MTTRRQFLLHAAALPILVACAAEQPACPPLEPQSVARLIDYAKRFYIAPPNLAASQAQLREIAASAEPLLAFIDANQNASEEQIRVQIAEFCGRDSISQRFYASGDVMLTRTETLLALMADGRVDSASLEIRCG